MIRHSAEPINQENDMTANDRNVDGNTSSAMAASVWIAGVAALCVGGSYVYACAAPFAAIAALAALKMDRKGGLALVIVAWMANQAIGFAVLDYPHTANTYAWGLAIGVAAIAGFAAARAIAAAEKAPGLTKVAAFPASFVFYQGGLYAASFALGGSEYAFSLEVVGYVLRVNAMAFVGLLILHRAVVALNAVRRSEVSTAVTRKV